MGIPDWSSLRSLGRSRLLQTSYLWFILVPILVKVTTKIDSSRGLTVVGYPIHFNLVLPFSWELFFYSAVFASLANLIYLWKCPNIIKNFSSYSDFKEQGKEREQLRKEFEVLLLKHYKKIQVSDLQHNVEEYIRSFCVPRESELSPEQIPKNPWMAVRIISAYEINPDKVAEAFWFVRDFAETLNKGYKALCFWFYVVALLLILSVSVQNIWFVIRYSIDTHLGA